MFTWRPTVSFFSFTHSIPLCFLNRLAIFLNKKEEHDFNMKEIHVFLYCVGLLVLMGFSSLFSVQCEKVDAKLECSSSSNLCSTNGQISEVNKTIVVNSLISCGTCTLNLNTSVQNGIQMDIISIPSWSQLYHFYIISAGIIHGVTEKSHTLCSIVFPTNELELHFRMDAVLVIQATQLDYVRRCSNSNATICKETNTDCNNLIIFDNVWNIPYEKTETVIDSEYLEPTIYRKYGDDEIKGELPPCPLDCTCYLYNQSLVTHCDGKATQTLLVHPDLEPTDILMVIFMNFINRHLYPFKSLDASSRQLEFLDVNAFLDLRYVNRLNLNKNLLTHIEPGTFGSNQIVVLQLADNKLTVLASDLFNSLSFLALLDLHGNQLTTLHENLFTNTLLLSWLDLSRNKLNELLPEVVSPLRNMLSLILNENNLSFLQPRTFQNMKDLVWLYLDDNDLTEMSTESLNGLGELKKLHLNGNQLTTIESDVFQGTGKVKELLLSRNNITFLSPDAFDLIPNLLFLTLDDNQLHHLDVKPFIALQRLLALNISANRLKSLDHGLPAELQLPTGSSTDSTKVARAFPKLRLLISNDNQIQTIEANVFLEMPMIETIELRGNLLKRVDKSTFRQLESNDTYVIVDEPATCCFIETAQCRPQNPKEPYLTCLRLLPYPSLRVFMWIFGLFAFVGNLSVLLWRCTNHGRENIVQVLLIENLAASDLLMGVNMLIIASADAYYQQYFPSESGVWRNGPVCKFAGILSVLSSEASVFFITLISIDRFLAIKYPRGMQRLTKKSATIALTSLWSLALLLSIIPTCTSGLNPDFYDVSEVCIGLPFVRAPIYLNKSVVAVEFHLAEDYSVISAARDQVIEEDYLYPETGNNPGLYFSIVLFLGINFLCFFVVAVSYIFIFIIVKQTSGRAGKSRSDQEITLAIRMGAIILTDFMCWVPIVTIGILVQSATVTISPVVYVYIVVLILPINSAVNPYIYTIAIYISDYRARMKKAENRKVDMKKNMTSSNTAESKANLVSTSFSDQTMQTAETSLSGQLEGD